MHCELCLSDHAEDVPCHSQGAHLGNRHEAPRSACPRRAGLSPRHRVEPLARVAPWCVRVQHPEGVDVHGVELARGGLFLHCREPFPPLLTRLSLTLRLEGEDVACEGEVVRHVDAAHAHVWSGSPGIGVQLARPPPRLRELFERVRLHAPATVDDAEPPLSER
ncbi:PilZ domain-containing protein [Myxococcus sp. K15C18031901]|uniref:PilZ domain-containing protein n=1 Tax=Myxococcus dinghuensis TaxID=2906761 RepID=UPI0020A71146|nr:PilZ domain-containing protein [Myxococcus dinghuensis]MCP3101024.1 PilZ domain-containing protein [Myxococcus dinghuensis]